MIIYKCVLSGDELFSDSKPKNIKYMQEQGLYKVRGDNVKITQEAIQLAGANASAEGEDADEGDEGSVQQGIDIEIYHGYKQCLMFDTWKGYTADHLKSYLKLLKQKKVAEEPGLDVKAFEASMLSSFKHLKTLKEPEFFYTEKGEDRDEGESILAIKIWEIPEGETDDTPFYYYFAHGVVEEKC